MSKKDIPFVELEVAQIRLSDGADVVLKNFQQS